jgi:segregation and condensation protein B
LVYATSKLFMDYFGINSADELPRMKEIFSENLVEPTLIKHTPDIETATEVSGEISLIVSEDGELIENNDEQENPEKESE